jgi:hypothetical protein
MGAPVVVGGRLIGMLAPCRWESAGALSQRVASAQGHATLGTLATTFRRTGFLKVFMTTPPSR